MDSLYKVVAEFVSITNCETLEFFKILSMLNNVLSMLHNRSINFLSTEEKTAWKNSKTFIEYSQAIDDVCKNLEDYNPTKKIIVLDDMIKDIEANKKLNHIVTE